MVIKFSGWELIRTKNGKFSIFYEAGLVGKSGGLIYISEEVYNDAKQGEIDLKSLFNKHNLYDAKHLVKTKKVILDHKRPTNSPSKYYGRGLIASEENGHYFMQYQKAAHGGGFRKIEIPKQAYPDIRKNDLSATEVIQRYNLYDLDVAKNDLR